MNAIEAFKALQQGKTVRFISSNATSTIPANYNKPISIRNFLDCLLEEQLLSDNWEIVKEKKVMSGTVTWFVGGGTIYPCVLDGNIDVFKLVGRDTKLTIEYED